MNFKNYDFLSPHITLYFKGNSIHPSIFSGVLSIFCFLIILAFGIYFAIDFIEKGDKAIYFFNRYIEDAGIFPVNASSMFHFIQLVRTDTNKFMPMDFDIVRIIGLEKTIDNYMVDTDLSKIDHWLYEPCDNKTDARELGYLITQEYFEQSACIKKYYDSKNRKYYDNSDKNFRWPIIKYGCSHPNRTFYGLVVERCRNDSLKTNCKSKNEINDYLAHFSITFQLIDHYPDMLNYKTPFIKYFYGITNGIFNDSLTINHLNFNPAKSVTHNGIFIDSPKEDKVYIFTQNEKTTISPGGTEIIVSFYFWMQNSLQYYDRSYKKIQDLLSDIGGFGSIIIDIAITINLLISNYVTLLDTEESILSSDKINFGNGREDQRPSLFIKINEIIHPPKKKNKFNNNNQKSSFYNLYSTDGILPLRLRKNEESKSDPNRKIYYYDKNNNESKNSLNFNNNDKIRTERDAKINKKPKNLVNSNLESFKKAINELENGEKGKKFDNTIKKNNFSFTNYIFHLINYKHRNPSISYFEKFRTQMLSEENIIQNHLDIYKLLKKCNLERHNPFYLTNLDKKT